jgi:hypothetical protein
MKIQTFLWVTLATLVSWQVMLPAVNKLKLPLGQTYGIISHAVEMGRNPSTNIAIYLLLLLVPSLIILGWTTLQPCLSKALRQGFARLPHRLISPSKALPLLVIVPITFWILNITVPVDGYITGFPKDGFHFGEKIGLTTAYLQSPRSFFDRDYMLIHGFGLNVLPGVLARLVGGQDLSVALTLYVVYLQSFLAIVFSFLILYEVAVFLAPQHRWQALLSLSLLYFALHGTVFGLIDRDTVFLLQAYLALRWLRHQNTSSDHLSLPSFLYPFFVAFTIPFGILYVYDRASYFIVIFVCALVYTFITAQRHTPRVLIASLTGFLSAALLLSLSLGFKALPSAIPQIRYWAKVSGLFTGLPYPEIAVSIGSLINWLPILLQTLTLTLLCLQLRHESSTGRMRDFLKAHYLPIFLLLCAIFYMRVALGRSDAGHLISPGFFAVFAFIAAIGQAVSRHPQFRPSWQNLLLTAGIAACLVNMNSVAAAANLAHLAQYPASIHSLLTQKNTQLLAPDQQAVAQKIQPRLSSQSCFYTLTSEGLWYEILDKPPCSRYWYLIYATTPETQAQVIEDLEKTKPRLILYSGGFGDVLDDVPKEASHLPVHQYIWTHYRPQRRIQNRWLWIRRSQDTSLDTLLISQPPAPSGYFEEITAPIAASNMLKAKGWAIDPGRKGGEEKKPIPKSVILLTVSPEDQPDQDIPINLGQVSQVRPDVATVIQSDVLTGWSIDTNQLRLPKGKGTLKAWVYNSVDYKFYQIPKSHPFEVK